MIAATMDTAAEVNTASETRPFVDDASRWTAVVARDRRADEVFWYSVATTGVYCRPSCGARLARRENVAFHDDRAAAEAAGFRPCKRCRPDQPPREALWAVAVTRACRRIETADVAPALATLAAEAGTRLVVQVTGPDAGAAIEAIGGLFDRNFNENETDRGEEGA